MEAESSAGSEEGGDCNGVKMQGASELSGAVAAASWLPPVKREKQKRKGVGGGGGLFESAGGVGCVAFAADEKGGQGGENNAEIDDFAGWGGVSATFQKRKPRALDGFRSAVVAASPSVPKVNTHFMAGTGVSDDIT